MSHRNFASVAEAVAHFSRQGYVTTSTETSASGAATRRIMEISGTSRPCRVIIDHMGLLDVQAREFVGGPGNCWMPA